MTNTDREKRFLPRLYYYAAPNTFYALAGKLAPIFAVIAVILTLIGLWIGMVMAPVDAVQGEVYRIIHIHVAAAWMSMFIYVVMAFWALIGLSMNTRLSFLMAQALAPTGAIFCFLALWTGALWGKPTWGTYWVWDARLTSQLLLLFLYFGFIALTHAIEDPRRADRAGAVLALVGVVNVPIIYFSVKWWNTLHQGASIGSGGKASVDPAILVAMLVVSLAAWAYAIAVSLWRVRTLILQRERNTDWVGAELARQKGEI